MKLWMTGLLAFIALGLMIGLTLLPKRVVPNDGVKERGPQHQSQSLETLVYDEQGRPHYRLLAASARRYSSEDISYFEQPLLQQFNQQQQISWVVSAAQAVLVQQRQLYLKGQVIATNQLAESTLQKVLTEQAQIDLQDQTIQSDHRVTLDGLQFTSQGSGLWGNFNQRVFTLLNAVKTHYDVQPRP